MNDKFLKNLPLHELYALLEIARENYYKEDCQKIKAAITHRRRVR